MRDERIIYDFSAFTSCATITMCCIPKPSTCQKTKTNCRGCGSSQEERAEVEKNYASFFPHFPSHSSVCDFAFYRRSRQKVYNEAKEFAFSVLLDNDNYFNNGPQFEILHNANASNRSFDFVIYILQYYDNYRCCITANSCSSQLQGAIFVKACAECAADS
ncbi:hypothetical protein V9T40_010114 [Parthenolecanium corni]|uniref:Uncharacterized protein n=1 Tax=Parthenolecanium corni TaxID=536013 RepID=A0AAN9Y5A0_9HEMI